MNLRDFGIALCRLIYKAYPSADNVTRDMFARDHFVEHVGSGDLRIHLRSQKPDTLEQAINIAAELELRAWKLLRLIMTPECVQLRKSHLVISKWSYCWVWWRV